MTVILGIILAGGQGSRMGGADKALLRLQGMTLVEHAFRRLQPQVGRIAISANGDPARFAFLNCPVLPDEAPSGPLSGILAGLVHARLTGADAVVSVAVDTPFFPADLVTRLLAAAGPGGAAIATSGGRAHPTFGLWPLRLEEPLRIALRGGRAKLMRFADEAGAARAEFPESQPDPFRNLNTPDDLANAEIP